MLTDVIYQVMVELDNLTFGFTCTSVSLSELFSSLDNFTTTKNKLEDKHGSL